MHLCDDIWRVIAVYFTFTLKDIRTIILTFPKIFRNLAYFGKIITSEYILTTIDKFARQNDTLRYALKHSAGAVIMRIYYRLITRYRLNFMNLSDKQIKQYIILQKEWIKKLNLTDWKNIRSFIMIPKEKPCKMTYVHNSTTKKQCIEQHRGMSNVTNLNVERPTGVQSPPVVSNNMVNKYAVVCFFCKQIVFVLDGFNICEWCKLREFYGIMSK